MTARSERPSLAVGAWAVFAISTLLAEPVIRLGARAARTIAGGLRPGEWLGLAVVVATFCYVEGYRALQRRFVPTVVSRALSVAAEGRGVLGVLAAPLCALSLLRAGRGTLCRAWLGLAAIMAAASLVRALPSPWRGIVDAGVASALAWGLVSLWAQFLAAVAPSLRFPSRVAQGENESGRRRHA